MATEFTARDLSNNLWNVKFYEGRYVAICRYFGGIAASLTAATEAEIRRKIEWAN